MTGNLPSPGTYYATTLRARNARMARRRRLFRIVVGGDDRPHPADGLEQLQLLGRRHHAGPGASRGPRSGRGGLWTSTAGRMSISTTDGRARVAGRTTRSNRISSRFPDIEARSATRSTAWDSKPVFTRRRGPSPTEGRMGGSSVHADGSADPTADNRRAPKNKTRAPVRDWNGTRLPRRMLDSSRLGESII